MWAPTETAGHVTLSTLSSVPSWHQVSIKRGNLSHAIMTENKGAEVLYAKQQ